MEKSPFGLTALVGFGDIEVVGLHVDRDHRLLVEIDHLEARVVTAESRGT